MGYFYTLFTVMAGIFIVMLGMRLYIQFKSSRMKGKAAPVINGKAGKILKRSKQALFYFYSPSCGACKAMTPIVKKLSSENDNVVTVDISVDMATARQFGVMATPTLIVVRNGLIQDIRIGPQSPASIELLLS